MLPWVKNAYGQIGSSYSQSCSYGGGIYCEPTGIGEPCPGPTIRNCVITGNATSRDSAKAAGSGICGSSGPIINCIVSSNEDAGIAWCKGNISGCIISDNAASGLFDCHGPINNCTINSNKVGGVFVCEGPITNCTVSGNGGTGLIACSAPISNCVVTGNKGGGVINFTAPITNCTISYNSTKYFGGGGVVSMCSDGWTIPTITNCIIWGNVAPVGPQVLVFGGSVSISHSDIQSGHADIQVELDGTLYWGEGNIDTDPCFVEPGYWDPNGTPDDANDDFWVDGDYHLLPDSLCIDAGDPNYVPAPNETDLDGNPRVLDGDNDGNSVVDMGAYEANYVEVQMKFTPQAFNPNSQGNWFKLHFVLPEGFVVEDVDVSKPALCKLMDTDGVAESNDMNVFVNEEGLVEIEAFFDRGAFSLCRNGKAERNVIILGILCGTRGQYFYGTDTIKIINKTWGHLAGFGSHWLEEGCGEPDWCSGQDLNQDSVVNLTDFALFHSCCIEIVAE